MVDLDKINKELRILGSSGSAIQTAREDVKRKFFIEMTPDFNMDHLNQLQSEKSLNEESPENKNDKKLLLPKAKQYQSHMLLTDRLYEMKRTSNISLDKLASPPKNPLENSGKTIHEVMSQMEKSQNQDNNEQ